MNSYKEIENLLEEVDVLSDYSLIWSKQWENVKVNLIKLEDVRSKLILKSKGYRMFKIC